MARNEDTGAELRSRYLGDGGTRAVFSQKVADYVASRPGYPDALLKTLRTVCAPGPDVTVADVGAGTGRLTRGLLSNGYRVVAVEPNQEMRAAADQLLGRETNYRSVDGTGEAMPLPTGSIQLITVAQAFHWFEAERACREFLRVLTPQGRVALIWNDRMLEEPLQQAIEEVFDAFGGEKRRVLVAHESERADIPRFFGRDSAKEFQFPNSHRLDEQGLASLVFSRSYMPGRLTETGREVARRMRGVFERFSTGGTVEIGYRTIAIVGRPELARN